MKKKISTEKNYIKVSNFMRGQKLNFDVRISQEVNGEQMDRTDRQRKRTDGQTEPTDGQRKRTDGQSERTDGQRERTDEQS